MMEQQTGTVMNEAENRRQRQLASLAKARAARAANVEAAKKLAGEVAMQEFFDDRPPFKEEDIPLMRSPGRKKRKKTTKAGKRLLVAAKEAVAIARGKTTPPDNWLDGIHHAPNGCPIACNATRCVITGENVCAHPDTNLQSKYLSGGFPEVVDRFNAARMEIKRLDAERSLKK